MLRCHGITSRAICAALLLGMPLVALGAVRTKSGSGSPELTPGAHRVMIAGAEIAYHVAGSGPVVVAHPGGPGLEWTILRMPQVEKFATVVYIEPIGTGSSGRLPDSSGFTMERYVGDVEGVRAHLGLGKLVLLGHSHGGFIAQSYALAHPDRLRGLILYDTSPTTGAEWQKDVAANLQWFKNESWFAEAADALAHETSASTDDEKPAACGAIGPDGEMMWIGMSVYAPRQFCTAYRTLFVLAKEAGGWKIVHHHYSQPTNTY